MFDLCKDNIKNSWSCCDQSTTTIHLDRGTSDFLPIAGGQSHRSLLIPIHFYSHVLNDVKANLAGNIKHKHKGRRRIKSDQPDENQGFIQGRRYTVTEGSDDQKSKRLGSTPSSYCNMRLSEESSNELSCNEISSHIIRGGLLSP